MKIGIIQFPTVAGDQAANLQTLSPLVSTAAEAGCKVVCCGEYALTGTPQDVNLPADALHEDHIPQLIDTLAVRNNITVIAGCVRSVQETGQLRSSCLVANKNGEYLFADKLYPGAIEREHLSPGDQHRSFSISIEEEETQASVLLCNDWHQPWYPFLLAHKGIRVFFAPFSTPHTPVKRLEAWRRFMPARAYDCRSFIFACNTLRQAPDKGGGIAVWGATGEEVYKYTQTDSHLAVVTVALEELQRYKSGNGGMRDKDFPSDLNTSHLSRVLHESQ